MNRIKCPNCGSTTKPELVWEDRNSNYTRKTDVYECGCGQRFEVIFDMSGYNLLKEEN
jgi:hypothetical protein